MTFLNPYLLFALAAVAIPVIIHLFNRRKARVIDWGAMQFLLGSLINRKRRILVEEFILMALRCLLVAVLVLIFTRPFTPVDSGASWLIMLPALLAAAVLVSVSAIMARRRHWRWLLYAVSVALVVGVVYVSQNQELLHAARWKSSTEQDVAIVLDGSTSMRVHVDGVANFTRAVEEARRVIESLGPDDHVSILVAGGIAQTVTPEPVNVRGDLERYLVDLQPVGGTLAVADALSAATAALAQGHNASKKIVLISDGQGVGWDTDNTGKWEFIADTLETLPTVPKVIARFLPLPSTFHNATIASVELSRDVIGTDRPVTVRVRVENTGTATLEPSGLQVQFDGGETLTSDVDKIEPGESTQVNFQHRFTGGGLHLVETRLLAADDLAEDNSQSRVVNIQSRLPVLLIDGSGQSRPADRATTFVEIALAPSVDESASTANEKKDAGETLIAARVVSAPDLSSHFDFSPFRVVMLLDVPRLGTEVAASLASFVQRGGGLLVAPGPRCEADFYRNWKLPDGKHVIPAELVERRVAGPSQASVRLAADTFQHPALERLLANSKTDLSRADIFGYWLLKMPPADNQVREGGRFDNGDLFLVEHALGRGLVTLTALSLDDKDSTLPSMVAFLPLLHEVTYRLAAPATPRLNLEPSSVLRLSLPYLGEIQASDTANTGIDNSSEITRQTVDLTVPRGALRKATLENRDDQSLITLAGAIEPGVYRAELRGSLAQRFPDLVRTEADQSNLLFTISLPVSESRLDPLSPDEEATVEKRIPYFHAASTEQLVAAITGDIPGHELWKYLAIAAVVVLLAESFITRWIAQQRKMGTTETVDFVSEGERLSTFQERARDFLQTVRSE